MSYATPAGIARGCFGCRLISGKDVLRDVDVPVVPHLFATSGAIKAAGPQTPGAVRRAVADIKAALDKIEREIT